MELVGEEKKIQALFCDLKLADQQITPRFTSVWIRAESRTPGPRNAFKLWLVASAVLLVTLFSLTLWSIRRQQNQLILAGVTGPANSNLGSSQTTKHEQPNPLSTIGQHHPVSPRLVGFPTRRKASILPARRVEIQNAAAISNWQSPTITFLRSPGDEVLSSLPQLNESVNKLRSFLPSRDNY
ncbi:MAG: hypothetical protein ABI596_00595 [Pyrinomonadaceae bacterium]